LGKNQSLRQRILKP